MKAKASRGGTFAAFVRSAGTVTAAHHFAWIDGTKALALLWIVLVHWNERVFGYGDFANPTNAWPPLAARFAQLQPLSAYGEWNWPLSLLRVVGWMGEAVCKSSSSPADSALPTDCCSAAAPFRGSISSSGG